MYDLYLLDVKILSLYKFIIPFFQIINCIYYASSNKLKEKYKKKDQWSLATMDVEGFSLTPGQVPHQYT